MMRVIISVWASWSDLTVPKKEGGEWLQSAKQFGFHFFSICFSSLAWIAPLIPTWKLQREPSWPGRGSTPWNMGSINRSVAGNLLTLTAMKETNHPKIDTATGTPAFLGYMHSFSTIEGFRLITPANTTLTSVCGVKRGCRRGKTNTLR